MSINPDILVLYNAIIRSPGLTDPNVTTGAEGSAGTNAKIPYPEFDFPSPTAVAININPNNHGWIAAVGSDAEIRELFSSHGVEFNLEGRTIIPGLVDCHIHLEQYALNLLKIDCEVDSRAACLQLVAERAQKTPDREWIQGHGWNQNDWDEGFGDAQLLDRVSQGHPVYLSAKSLHAAWVNSLALEAAGINAQTRDPDGGQIQRSESGQPTGILFEKAMNLVFAIIPKPKTSEIEDHMLNAQDRLIRMGVTGVHDFDDIPSFIALQNLHSRKKLKLRTVKHFHQEDLSHLIKMGLKTGFGDDWLKIGSIKAFADGALGPHTAWMLQGYEDEPNNLGISMLDTKDLVSMGEEAVSNGLALAIHAIGDHANQMVCDAFETIRFFEKNHQLSPGRHRIEHVQLLHRDDAHRLNQLDLIGSVQPIHVLSDMEMAEKAWGARSALSYAYWTLLKENTRVCFGSDAPVDSPNPFYGIYAAVTRRRLDGYPDDHGWYPEQKIPLLRALEGYSSGAAYATGMENRLGKIKTGFDADLLVLSDDPFACAPDNLYKIHPLATMIAGRWGFNSLF